MPTLYPIHPTAHTADALPPRPWPAYDDRDQSAWGWDGQNMRVTRDGDSYRLEMTQWLPVAPAELFPFFADAHNLERITPSLLRFRVLPGAPRPTEMREGALIDYKLKVRGVPIRWRTRIEGWDPPRGFVDTQLKGPYRLWHHTHRFEPQTCDGVSGTLCTDLVRYRPPGGPLMGLVNHLFVQRDVEAIFAYRAKVLEEMFNREDAESANTHRKLASPLNNRQDAEIAKKALS